MTTSSVEFWRGEVDGAPVVAIATNLERRSENRKTGHMIQTYIMRRDMTPVASTVSGADAAVCGECPLRPAVANGARCYVNTGWLTRLWDSWHAGNFPRVSPAELGRMIRDTGAKLRRGAWGDPAVVPAAVWAELGPGLGYSHQWRDVDVADYAMASVETLADAADAQSRGWRTYRVDLEGAGAVAGEVECPNTTRGVLCADCGLCNGRGGAKSVVIKPLGKWTQRAPATS